MNLVLASSSPRRQELLDDAGIHHHVCAPEIDEWDHSTHPDLSPADLVRLNARRKAEAVSKQFPGHIILAADTVVYCEGRLLGKPSDRDHAAAMLAWLAGKTHEVLTGVAWLDPAKKEIHETIARTQVTFRPLDRTAIDSYMKKVHVMDKAGAYAAQEHGTDIIERIEGSLTNVIGLPMEIVSDWHHNLSLEQSG